MNKPGDVVGFTSGPDGERAVLWARDGSVTLLPGASSAQTSRALGINERGDVVGSWDAGLGLHAILWRKGGAEQDLGTLPGHTTSEAADVNASGDIVGYSAGATGARRAVRWTSDGTILDLGTLPGGDFSQALRLLDRLDNTALRRKLRNRDPRLRCDGLRLGPRCPGRPNTHEHCTCCGECRCIDRSRVQSGGEQLANQKLTLQAWRQVKVHSKKTSRLANDGRRNESNFGKEDTRFLACPCSERAIFVCDDGDA